MTPDADDRVDGRTARRDRNREAVLDAVLELFREDAVTPSPSDVAARSGVSTRSVQRYFEDMDALVREAMARHLERVGPLFVLPDPGVGLQEERIERLVTSRLRLYEEVAPMVRAALLRIRTNAVLRERLVTGRAVLRQQVADMFAPELEALGAAEGRQALDAVDALLGFDSLELLRVGLGRSQADAVALLGRAVRLLLRPAG